MSGTQAVSPGQQAGAGATQKPAVPPAKKPEPLPAIPPEFEAAKVMNLDPARLIEILKDPQASVFQKAKACQRLAVVGGKDAVPALETLLGDPQLSHYARFALEPMPDAAAGEALRRALPRLKGRLLVGVINSIGQRRDPEAVEALAKLLYSADAEVAQAAAAALGRISGARAAKVLLDALARTKDPLRAAVAAAGLVCAERLLASGDRKQALAMYDTLSRPNVARVVRLAAMHGIIAAETGLDRPR